MKRILKIKVCGMKDPENIKQVLLMNPEWIGFIFYKLSKRYAGNLNFSFVNEMKDIKRVGVFVNSSLDEILALSEKFNLD